MPHGIATKQPCSCSICAKPPDLSYISAKEHYLSTLPLYIHIRAQLYCIILYCIINLHSQNLPTHQYIRTKILFICTRYVQSLQKHCNTLQHSATHCNTLQHSATHCNTLQHTAPHCTAQHHTAPHCTTLHHTAPHCNTLHRTATHTKATRRKVRGVSTTVESIWCGLNMFSSHIYKRA